MIHPIRSCSGVPQCTYTPSTSVTITSSYAKSTFSHPNGWTQSGDGTLMTYVNPNGPEMVGVSRRVGVDGPGAISRVEAAEYNGHDGFAVTGSGQVKDATSGARIYEVTGTYTRGGQPVTFMMHSVDVPGGAEYVLVVRTPAASSAEMDPLMAALRASFQPAS